MIVNGLDIVRRVYRRLKMPSQQALPWKYALETVASVIARKKLDLALSSQNSLGTTGDWFTPSSPDFPLAEQGMDNVMLPIRVETRSSDSDDETGDDVPIVNYEVLNTSVVGAVSFYSDPMRIAFRDSTDYITQRQYRLVYEGDLEGDFAIDSVVGLPAYFAEDVVLESAYELLDQVEDDTPAWQKFLDRVERRWLAQIVDRREGWKRFVHMFKGRAQIPKRTFFDNLKAKTTPRNFR